MRKCVKAEVDTNETKEKLQIWHETGGTGETLQGPFSQHKQSEEPCMGT